MYAQLEYELLPNCSVIAAAGSVNCTHWIVCRLYRSHCVQGTAEAVVGFRTLCGGIVRDARRDPSSNDDVAGLEALDYWTHLCDCARRKTDVRLFVSNEYLSFRFGCIIEPTGFIMNKHKHTLTRDTFRQYTLLCKTKYIVCIASFRYW